MEAAEQNPELLERIRGARRAASTRSSAGRTAAGPGVDGPVVFMCAEFGFHQSMPIYSGGLGVLAGDILKEASDQALEMIGIGLLYRRGYFRQRLDIRGRQQEYWLESDPKSLPIARVTSPDGTPLKLEVPLFGKPLALPGLARRRRPRAAAPARRRAAGERRRAALDVRAALRGEPGRAARPVRAARDRRRARPAGARDRAGRRPPQRGPPGARRARVRGGRDRAGRRRARRRSSGCGSGSSSRRTRRSRPATRPTRRDEFLPAYDDLRERLGHRRGGVPRPLPRRARRGGAAGDDAARDPDEPPPQRRQPAARRGVAEDVASRSSRARSSRRSPTSRTARTCPTFVSRADPDAARRAHRRHVDPRARARAPGSASARSRTPPSGLPAARRARGSSSTSATKSAQDSLLRGEQLDYVQLIESSLDPDALTIGFARRLATYKRFHLLNQDPDRTRADLRRRRTRPSS